MRWLRLVVGVPYARILPIQRIPVQEEALLHFVTKGKGAEG